jgi:carbamoyl-phosphate synthase small subunit
MKGVIGFGTTPTKEALLALDACPSMEGLDLASVVSTQENYAWGNAQAPYHVVAIDYGIKRNILRLFDDHDVRVTVVPSTTSAIDILAHNPDGVFLSNGPGDPAAIDYAPDTIRKLSEHRMPIFGICLGHQLVGLSFGGHTVKMPYGHRGGNHPVKDLETGKVLITSQNHGFAVAGSADGVEGAPDLEVTHLNLNDGSLEGLRHKTLPIFTVQYHPEAAPGPHDAVPLFDQFVTALKARRNETSQPLD